MKLYTSTICIYRNEVLYTTMDPEPMQPFQIYFTYIVILEHFASSSDIWMPCFALICNKKRKRMGFDSEPQKVPTQKWIDIHLFDWLWL